MVLNGYFIYYHHGSVPSPLENIKYIAAAAAAAAVLQIEKSSMGLIWNLEDINIRTHMEIPCNIPSYS